VRSVDPSSTTTVSTRPLPGTRRGMVASTVGSVAASL
jgi:hypothetical protein